MLMVSPHVVLPNKYGLVWLLVTKIFIIIVIWWVSCCNRSSNGAREFSWWIYVCIGACWWLEYCNQVEPRIIWTSKVCSYCWSNSCHVGCLVMALTIFACIHIEPLEQDAAEKQETSTKHCCDRLKDRMRCIKTKYGASLCLCLVLLATASFCAWISGASYIATCKWC